MNLYLAHTNPHHRLQKQEDGGMEIITLSGERWEIYIAESTDGLFDAHLWDNNKRSDPVAQGSGHSRDASIVELFTSFADSRTKIPADVFIPFRALYLECAGRLTDKATKRCKVK